MSRKALQLCLAILGLVPFITGIVGMFRMTRPTPLLDSFAILCWTVICVF